MSEPSDMKQNLVEQICECSTDCATVEQFNTESTF